MCLRRCQMAQNGKYVPRVHAPVCTSNIAMGMHCSPDIANLFGAFYEELQIPNMKHILFYGQYIDDCLAFVVARNETEAQQTIVGLKFPGVKLVWDCSQWHALFLDLWLFINPVTHRIEHKPYKKAMNNSERLPWISHHPLTIKRGTFISEMSWLPILSSRWDLYDE